MYNMHKLSPFINVLKKVNKQVQEKSSCRNDLIVFCDPDIPKIY